MDMSHPKTKLMPVLDAQIWLTWCVDLESAVTEAL